MTVDNANRVIGRLPSIDRFRILLALKQGARDNLVAVEWSPWRKLTGAKVAVGAIVSVAHVTAGQSDVMLIIRPADDGADLAINAGHIMRVRSAHPWGKAQPGAHRLGEVLAGPPLKKAAS